MVCVIFRLFDTLELKQKCIVYVSSIKKKCFCTSIFTTLKICSRKKIVHKFGYGQKSIECLPCTVSDSNAFEFTVPMCFVSPLFHRHRCDICWPVLVQLRGRPMLECRSVRPQCHQQWVQPSRPAQCKSIEITLFTLGEYSICVYRMLPNDCPKRRWWQRYQSF